MGLNWFNDCRVQYNQMIVMTLALCCIVVILIVVQSEELQETPQLKPFMKWTAQVEKLSFFKLQTSNWTHVIDNRFLSFSIDSSEIYHGFRYPSLRDKRLIKIVSHLGGGYLRLGGTMADLIVFTPSYRAWPVVKDYRPVDSGLCGYEGRNCPNMTLSLKLKTINEYRMKNKPNVLMSADDWIEINEFCQATDMKLLFDFNVLLRSNNSWDPRNAELLLDFSLAQNYHIDWELGNEPNLFRRKYGVEVAPGRMAIDYTVLRQLLYRYTLYKDSLLIGPSVTNPKNRSEPNPPLDYLRDFLANGGDVNAVSWHFYYMGPNVTVADFLDPSVYDSLQRAIDKIKGAVKQSGVSPQTPIWIGETGSTYGGGAENLADRFVASLLHLDKLGTSAARGISLVVRQSLYRGNYRLIDTDTMTPLGDFWVSVLFKKLVGREVLDISEIASKDMYRTIPLRLYAHCSTTPPYPVIYGVNLNNETLGISLFSNNTGDLFSVTGYPDLLSKELELNGVMLKLRNDQSLPKLTPVSVDLRVPVPVRPYSLFFLVSYNNLTICEKSSL